MIMQLSQFIKGMVLLTSLCLIYIHLQMQILDLAYQGKSKEQTIKKLSEDNGNMTYKILKLQSAHHLGDKLLSEGSAMQFVGETQIVKLPALAATPATEETALISFPQRSSPRNPLLNFFAIRSQAEAKPQE